MFLDCSFVAPSEEVCSCVMRTRAAARRERAFSVLDALNDDLLRAVAERLLAAHLPAALRLCATSKAIGSRGGAAGAGAADRRGRLCAQVAPCSAHP